MTGADQPKGCCALSGLGVAALATWRLTHLLAEEDGPFDAVVKLRRRLGDGLAGQLMDCFYCLSLWVAAPAALTLRRTQRRGPAVSPSVLVLLWLGLSGASCLLEASTAANVEEVHP
jgi:hypothetical protein